VLGETLTCVPSGFTGNGVALSYEWLREGALIGGAGAAAYELVAADVGHDVACRVTARNSAGDADSTSDAVTVGTAAAGPQGPMGPIGPTGPQGPAGPPGTFPDLRITCEIGSKREIECVLRVLDSGAKAKASKASFRVAGSKKTAKARGRKTLRAVIKGGRRSDRVIVRFTRGKANVRVVVPVGKTIRTKTR
jgi:hypothetical protein